MGRPCVRCGLPATSERPVRAAFLVLCSLLAAAGDAPPDPATPGTVASLAVEIAGLKDDEGTVHASLYASADGFPTRPAKAFRQGDAFISGGTARLVFQGLPPGGYAVAAYHDENGNGKLDTGFLGIPTEGVGASNDAKGFMGPPGFDDARVEVRAGENRIVVRIVY
jgi:uncharacterized protein (DUF2141 family)